MRRTTPAEGPNLARARRRPSAAVDLPREPRPRPKGPRRRTAQHPDRYQGGEQPRLHPRTRPGHSHQRRAQRPHRPEGGARRVVPAIHPARAGVLSGQHDLLQRGRRPVVNHISGQRPGQRHHEQQPQRRVGGHHRARHSDPHEKQPIAAPSADAIPVRADSHRGQRAPPDQRRQQHPGPNRTHPLAANNAPSTTAVNPYPSPRTA